jgi:hypothetical protein
MFIAIGTFLCSYVVAVFVDDDDNDNDDDDDDDDDKEEQEKEQKDDGNDEDDGDNVRESFVKCMFVCRSLECYSVFWSEKSMF